MGVNGPKSGPIPAAGSTFMASGRLKVPLSCWFGSVAIAQRLGDFGILRSHARRKSR